VAFASIRRTVLLARLLAARGAFESNLAEASCIVAAVAVLAVRAHGLRAVDTAIPNVALALARNAVATTMTRAPVGAHLLFARLAHEPRGTIAHAVDTATVSRAVAWAALERAIETGPSQLAHAVRAHTVAVARAIIGARSARAVHARESCLAVARAIVTDTRVGAIIETGNQRTVIPHPPIVARA